MYKKTPGSKSSLFKDWFLSYFFILLVPVLISGTVYIFALKIIKNETNRANMALLTQLQQTIDGEFKKLEQTAVQISINNRVNIALRVKGGFETSDQYNLIKMRSDIFSYQNTNGFIDYLYIYFKNNDTVANMDYTLDDSFYHSLERKNIVLGMEEWKKLMHETHKKRYMVLEGVNENNQYVSFVAYLQTIPIVGHTDNVGTLVQMVNTKTLLDMIEGVQWLHDGTVLIIDNGDQIVVSTQSLQFDEHFNYESLRDESDIIYTRIAGTKHAVCYISSEINTWKYIILMPTHVFWEQATYIRRVIYAALVLCITFGGIVSFIFTKRNYQPVHKLVQSITNGDIISMNCGYKEYDFIRNVINNVLVEKKNLAYTLEKKEDELRNSVLVRLLTTNNSSDIKAAEIFSQYEINPGDDWFLVILFQFEKYGGMFLNTTDNDETNGVKVVKYVISSIAEKFIKRKHIVLMADIKEDMLACILSSKRTGIHDCTREVFPVLNNARQLISRKFNMRLNISAGNVHRGAREIAISYREAADALEAQIFLNKDGILTYDEISYLKGNYYYPFSIENKLVNLIEAGDYEIALHLLDEILNKSFEDNDFSVEAVKCMMFDIVGTFIKVSNHIEYKEFLDQVRPYMRLTNCTSVADMKSETIAMLKLLCDFAEESVKEVKNKMLSEKVNAYLEENYNNVNLSIQLIAEHFGITTPSYLSRLYKVQTGERLLDKINAVRIEKSKQMLKEEKSIKDISRLVGFTTSSIFIRTFKNYEGLTPGQFKYLAAKREV